MKVIKYQNIVKFNDTKITKTKTRLFRNYCLHEAWNLFFIRCNNKSIQKKKKKIEKTKEMNE